MSNITRDDLQRWKADWDHYEPMLRKSPPYAVKDLAEAVPRLIALVEEWDAVIRDAEQTLISQRYLGTGGLLGRLRAARALLPEEKT